MTFRLTENVEILVQGLYWLISLYGENAKCAKKYPLHELFVKSNTIGAKSEIIYSHSYSHYNIPNNPFHLMNYSPEDQVGHMQNCKSLPQS